VFQSFSVFVCICDCVRACRSYKKSPQPGSETGALEPRVAVDGACGCESDDVS